MSCTGARQSSFTGMRSDEWAFPWMDWVLRAPILCRRTVMSMAAFLFICTRASIVIGAWGSLRRPASIRARYKSATSTEMMALGVTATSLQIMEALRLRIRWRRRALTTRPHTWEIWGTMSKTRWVRATTGSPCHWGLLRAILRAISRLSKMIFRKSTRSSLAPWWTNTSWRHWKSSTVKSKGRLPKAPSMTNRLHVSPLINPGLRLTSRVGMYKLVFSQRSRTEAIARWLYKT